MPRRERRRSSALRSTAWHFPFPCDATGSASSAVLLRRLGFLKLRSDEDALRDRKPAFDDSGVRSAQDSAFFEPELVDGARLLDVLRRSPELAAE
jgi:hypothetical protein